MWACTSQVASYSEQLREVESELALERRAHRQTKDDVVLAESKRQEATTRAAACQREMEAALKAAEEVTESFGCNKLYMHVRADNPEALGLFEGQGYFEPADAKASLTSEDITKRTNGLLTKIGIAESGHYLLMRNLSTDAAI